jgi:hypothetical protein
MFNYQRYNNQPVNPFNVPESDLNISVASTYTGASGNQAVIIGTGVETDDRNATFHFGRARASKDFYDVEGTVANTPIAIYVYCDTEETSYSWCEEHHVDIMFGLTDLSDWWLALDHNESGGDGDVRLISPPTVVLGSGSGTVTTDVNLINGQDTTVTVTHDNGPLPITYDIFLETSSTAASPSAPVTNSWVIYNADSPTLDPDPFYKVRFTGDSGWAGVGETGHVLDINASTTKTKRLNW